MPYFLNFYGRLALANGYKKYPPFCFSNILGIRIEKEKETEYQFIA